MTNRVERAMPAESPGEIIVKRRLGNFISHLDSDLSVLSPGVAIRDTRMLTATGGFAHSPRLIVAFTGMRAVSKSVKDFRRQAEREGVLDLTENFAQGFSRALSLVFGREDNDALEDKDFMLSAIASYIVLLDRHAEGEPIQEDFIKEGEDVYAVLQGARRAYGFYDNFFDGVKFMMTRRKGKASGTIAS